MLKCPYQHIIFTIPHELNYIGKGHPKLLYGVLFKAAWLTIERLARDPENVGVYTRNDSRTAYIWLRSQTTYTPAYPGHLWRCKQGWQMGMAQTKNKIAPYRKICSTFKTIFIKELESQLQKIDPSYYQTVKGIINSTKEVRWCVHNTPPTAHTKVIEEYLGRYICRIGVSNKKYSMMKNNRS